MDALASVTLVIPVLLAYSDIEGGDPDEVIDLLNLGQLKNKRLARALKAASTHECPSEQLI
jgi:hypothetical protein